LRSRLPERFSGTLPPLLVEAGVGLVLALLFGLVRIALVPWTDDAAPFALVFVSVVAAAVLGGWRSGLIALVIGQALVWFVVVHPQWSWGPADPAQLGGLVIATFGELVALAIIILYQREVDRGRAEREGQMDLLQKALAEIDHRTSNNYQAVLALILAQAKSAQGEAVKEALQQVADRIRAIAAVSAKLALASPNLEEVRIGEHLGDLCKQIEQGLSRPEVRLNCHFDDVLVPAEDTVCMSILVNELVTNALKHAFPDGRSGTITATLSANRGGLELVIADDGVGMSAASRSRGTGLGQRLIQTFVKRLRAKHQVSSNENGTRHRIQIPAHAA
jgi:two-component sensor histidine kinase